MGISSNQKSPGKSNMPYLGQPPLVFPCSVPAVWVILTCGTAIHLGDVAGSNLYGSIRMPTQGLSTRPRQPVPLSTKPHDIHNCVSAVHCQITLSVFLRTDFYLIIVSLWSNNRVEKITCSDCCLLVCILTTACHIVGFQGTNKCENKSRPSILSRFYEVNRGAPTCGESGI